MAEETTTISIYEYCRENPGELICPEHLPRDIDKYEFKITNGTVYYRAAGEWLSTWEDAMPAWMVRELHTTD